MQWSEGIFTSGEPRPSVPGTSPRHSGCLAVKLVRRACLALASCWRAAAGEEHCRGDNTGRATIILMQRTFPCPQREDNLDVHQQDI